MTLLLSIFYFSWASALLWIFAENERISRSDIWAVQIATIATFLGERAFAYWREGRQRKWDVADREFQRATLSAKVEEVRTTAEDTRAEIVKEVQETHKKLDDGIRSNLVDVLKKFDALPKQVSAQPTELSDAAVEKVAKKVAEVTNGGTKPSP